MVLGIQEVNLTPGGVELDPNGHGVATDRDEFVIGTQFAAAKGINSRSADILIALILHGLKAHNNYYYERGPTVYLRRLGVVIGAVGGDGG